VRRGRKLRRAGLVGLALLIAGCGERIDWSAPENFVLRERSVKQDDGVRLEYWSLVDASAAAVYAALADVDHYADFVPGVDAVQVLATGADTKTIRIAQRVIGRQSNATVDWHFFPAERRIEFHTRESTLSLNDGSFVVVPSPDGRRTLVRSSYFVREGEGQMQPVPIGVLAAGTRESFLGAAAAVKRRAIRAG